MSLKIQVDRQSKGNKSLRVVAAISIFVFAASLISECQSDSINIVHTTDRFRPYVFEIEDDEAKPKKANDNVDDSLDDILPDKYQVYQPPPGPLGSPIKVEISVGIFNVRDINEVAQDFNLEINLRLYWQDDRLSHIEIEPGKKYRTLNQNTIKKIWSPDIFIDHVKNISQPVLISRPASVRIYPRNVVRYSTRMTIQMSCPMNFVYYPADTQLCSVRFKSFALDENFLKLGWREGLTFVVQGFKLSSYDVSINGLKEDSIKTIENERMYSYVELEIRIRRRMMGHMIQSYLPSILFVVTSWLSFWVPAETVSARMTLVLTTFLTLITIFGVVRQSTVPTSYVKALDIWMIVCIIFVFLSVLQYAIILKIRSLNPDKKKKKLKEEPPVDDGLDKKGAFTWKLPFEKLAEADKEERANSITPISYLSWYYNDGKDFVPYHIRRPKLRNSRAPSFMTNSSQTISSNSRSPSPGNASLETSIAQQSHRSPGFSDKKQALPPSTNGATPIPPAAGNKDNKAEPAPNKYVLFTMNVDRISRIAFPSAFLFFQIIYWPWLLAASGYWATRYS